MLVAQLNSRFSVFSIGALDALVLQVPINVILLYLADAFELGVLCVPAKHDGGHLTVKWV